MSDDFKEVEVLPAGAVEALNRSEIESQIAIAHRWPRTMEKFKTRATEMATVDEETAASCLYRRPVGKDGGQQKYAEGMSIRMAEIVGASYGNLRVYATILSQTDRQVVARGMAIDLESNFASSSEVIEITVDRNGKPYSERQSAVVAKAALAKARRDATFQVVPKALAKPIEQAVRKLLLGDAKSLETRRGQVAGWVKTLGIEESRVWAALGVAGIADVGLKELETLTGLRTAIKDNETTIDEAFPQTEFKQPQPKNPTKENADGNQHRGDQPVSTQAPSGVEGVHQAATPQGDTTPTEPAGTTQEAQKNKGVTDASNQHRGGQSDVAQGQRGDTGGRDVASGDQGLVGGHDQGATPEPTPQAEAKAKEEKVASRSIQRRVAIQQGKPMPEFGGKDAGNRPIEGTAGLDEGHAGQPSGGTSEVEPATEPVATLEELVTAWVEGPTFDEDYETERDLIKKHIGNLAKDKVMAILAKYNARKQGK